MSDYWHPLSEEESRRRAMENANNPEGGLVGAFARESLGLPPVQRPLSAYEMDLQPPPPTPAPSPYAGRTAAETANPLLQLARFRGQGGL